MAEVGDRVRIRSAWPPGHVRTPSYLRGREGVIERVLDRFRDPERAAYRQEARPLRLYRVRFSMGELWGDAAERPEDTLDAEVYETWIEEAPHAP